jgi:hypothetical protein
MNTLLLLVAVTATLAQDPMKVAARNYQLQFENDWVRLVRVHYGPREVVPAHFHTERAAAYVYLNDGPPIVFRHVNLPYGDATRPATKTGSFRLYRGIKEVHSVENRTDQESDFLRVEFKTEPAGEDSLRGRFHREEATPGTNAQKIQFENPQVRISRLTMWPGKPMVPDGNSEPSVYIAVSPGARIAVQGKEPIDLPAGGSQWVNARERIQLHSQGQGAAEFLRFEFKTKPYDDPKDRTEGAHTHTH